MKIGDLVQFIVQTEKNKGAWLVIETKGAWAKLLGFYDDAYTREYIRAEYEQFIIQGNLEVINESR